MTRYDPDDFLGYTAGDDDERMEEGEYCSQCNGSGEGSNNGEIVLIVEVVEMIENQGNQHEPLDGEHQSNEIPTVDWDLYNENRDTLKLNPCNKRRTDTK